MARLVVSGAINWDISCFVERLPAPGEEVRVERLIRVSGGTGANVAVAAARILGPGEVALIGALGEDNIAPEQIAILNAEGINTEGIKIMPGEESGQAYIFIDREGQNVIATCPGANFALRAEHLKDSSLDSLIQGCRSIALTDPPLEIAASLIELAQRNKIPVLWDPGILISHGWEELQPLIKKIKTLFLNESEALSLIGTTEPDAAFRHLRRQGIKTTVVLKLGSRGAAILELTAEAIIEIPALPLAELGLKLVNTVGCGDAFVGAFAAYQALGAENKVALVKASLAAGLNAARPETRGSPDRKTLEEVEQRAYALGFVPQERKPGLE